jgi:hypothetical protein
MAKASNSTWSWAHITPHRAAVRADQVAQASLVGEPGLAVDLHHRLIGAQADGAARVVGVHLAAIEVGVAGVQQPAVRGANGDAGVAGGVAGEGDEEQLWG